MYFHITLAIIGSFASFGHAVDSSAWFERYGLGTPNLNRFNATVDMTVDPDTCDYSLTFIFTHDDTLPVPDDPPNQCNPANSDLLATDGEPYFADARWHYTELPDYMMTAAGFDHISLDFNPCGHPPIGSFNKPHYDIHFYRMPLSYREANMSCDVIPDLSPYVPLCVPFDQTTESGLGFFTRINVELEDAPVGFSAPPDTAIAYMGTHAWLVEDTPTVEEWLEPITITGFHADEITAYFEVMVPLEFITGSMDQTFSEDVTYTNQTMTDLPFTYTFVYDGDGTKANTLVIKGKSNVCADEFDELKNGGDGGTSGGVVFSSSSIVTMLGTMLSGLLSVWAL